MYKIIGADQKEYGPITADQVRQWMAEGRANGQTQARLDDRSEEHTSELQSRLHLVCRLLLEKTKNKHHRHSGVQSKPMKTHSVPNIHITHRLHQNQYPHLQKQPEQSRGQMYPSHCTEENQHE